jgi:hypothetical protein
MTDENSAWGLAFVRRGSGDSALYFLSILSSSYIARTIFVTYVAVTIAASFFVTIEAVLCLTGVKKNGLTSVCIPSLVYTQFKLTKYADRQQHQENPRLLRLHRASHRLGAQRLLHRADCNALLQRQQLVAHYQPGTCLPVHHLRRAIQSRHSGPGVAGRYGLWQDRSG